MGDPGTLTGTDEEKWKNSLLSALQGWSHSLHWNLINQA
jgi:hypothetical protein